MYVIMYRIGNDRLIKEEALADLYAIPFRAF